MHERYYECGMPHTWHFPYDKDCFSLDHAWTAFCLIWAKVCVFSKETGLKKRKHKKTLCTCILMRYRHLLSVESFHMILENMALR